MFAAAKVLQASTVPSLKPTKNQRLRCSAVPWVKLSGTTAVGRRCNVSSPIADSRLQRRVDIARVELAALLD